MRNPPQKSGATILVTGATGHLGSAVIAQLLQKMPAHRIAALARDENKASHLKAQGISVRLGDFDDRASLDRAMSGIEQVLLISGTDEVSGLQQHKNVVDAAKMAGAASVAYTSRNLKDRSQLENQLMVRHFQTEDYILESGLVSVLFRNALYMDTIPQFVGEGVFETGINLPTGEGRVAFALRSEQGEAIANALAQGVGESRIYTLTGSEACSSGDVAAALCSVSGKTVNYLPLERREFEAQLQKRGLPGAMIQKIVGFLIDIKNGQEEGVSPDMEELLGRKPLALQEGLKIFYQL